MQTKPDCNQRWNLADLEVGQYRIIPKEIPVPCGSIAHWSRKLDRRFIRTTKNGRRIIKRVA